MDKEEIEERRKILIEILRHEFDVYTAYTFMTSVKPELYLHGKKIYNSEDPIKDLAGNIIEMLRLK